MPDQQQDNQGASMSGDDSTRLFDKIDDLQRDMNSSSNAIRAELNDLTVEFMIYVSSKNSCKDKCEESHKAVFGNGGPGLKAKMWVVWGLLTAGGSTLIAVVKGWL